MVNVYGDSNHCRSWDQVKLRMQKKLFISVIESFQFCRSGSVHTAYHLFISFDLNILFP